MPDIDTVVKHTEQYNERNRGKHKKRMTYGTMYPQMQKDTPFTVKKSDVRNFRPHKRVNKVSAEDSKAMVDLYSDGVSIPKIAAHFEVSETTVKNYLKEAGVFRPASASQRWTSADFERIRELIAEGKSNKQIADILGRTLNSVNIAISKNDLRQK